MKRREIKDAHERSVIGSFKKHLEDAGRALTVISHPDPPDAVVEVDNQLTWLEITDAFIGPDFARSLTSYAADDTAHIPTQRKAIRDPDARFSDVVQSVVEKKYASTSIGNIYKKSGAGVLLVGLFSPFVGEPERDELIQCLSEMRRQGDGRFKEIYVYDQSHSFYQVP